MDGTTLRQQPDSEPDYESVSSGSRKKRRTNDASPFLPTGENKEFRRNYDDYTVAVVCAMGFEMSAVRYMLDKEHPRLPPKQGDSNLYIFGELSGHNVAIAWLPGTQGKGAAATVVTNMERTFPAIKWRLLVGIGGGVPSPKNDIRLGDIVVSMPDGSHGGVVQYDLGKDTEEGFIMKGCLLPPPPMLRHAVELMRSDHLGRPNRVDEFVSMIVGKGPNFSSYQRPSDDSDILFKENYAHVYGQGTCARCEQVSTITRPARTSKYPKIHYGLIASGDRVMRNATQRNKTGQDMGDLLCFEMEAAGIMAELPCLVIRGISDYADSHKNDIWQHHAAAAAAGCAKELLSYLNPNPRSLHELGFRRWAEQKSDSGFEPSGTEGMASLFKISPAALRRTTASGPWRLSEEDRWGILESLRFEQMDAREASVKKAHTRTCSWFLNKPDYLDWLDNTKILSHQGLLWVKGKPGAGKSTLAKFVFRKAREDLNGGEAISFFFNARGSSLEKSIVGMYRSLLAALLERNPELQSVFDSLPVEIRKNYRNHQWDVDLLKDLFEQAILKHWQQPITCFIDALDECEETQIRDMIVFFEQLGELAIEAGIWFRVFFTSRHYPFITVKRGLELILEDQEEHGNDIANYLNSELQIGHSLIAKQLRQEIQEKASGVFIWVYLVVKILNKQYDRGRIYELQRKLQSIPSDLHELFRDILTRDQENRDGLLLCVQCVLFAREPMRPQELYFAIISGIEPEHLVEWNRNDITIDAMKRFILDSSKGFAEVTRSSTPTVQFIHESVRDFLLKQDGIGEILPAVPSNFMGRAHERLKQCCLTYMNFAIKSQDLPRRQLSFETETEKKRFLAQRPFLYYAQRNVLYHADLAQGSGISQKNFLQDFPIPNWICLSNLFTEKKNYQYTSNVSMLYLLAGENMPNLIEIHPNILSCLDIEEERHEFPLRAALFSGSGTAFRSLLTAYAAHLCPGSQLYEECSKLYLNKTYSQRFNFRQRQPILSCMAQLGDDVLFAFFLKTEKFRPDATDDFGRRPLSFAAENGHINMVELLLATGQVDPDSKNNNGWTPLSFAAANGHETVVERLLATGQVDPDSKDNNGWTPLSFAAANGHKRVVEQLLATGQVDPNSKDNNGWTPLSFAAENGHDKVAELLLATREIEPDSKNNNGWTPLSFAAANGHRKVVERLLATGQVDPNSKDNNGWTPLSFAAGNGHEKVAELLLLATAQIGPDSENNNERTSLAFAVANRVIQVLEQFIAIR